MEGDGSDTPGHAGACGFLSGDGTDIAGAGLCGAHHKRRGWGTESHADLVEAAGALPCACISLYQ